MKNSNHDKLNDVHSVADALRLQLKEDFKTKIKKYIQQDPRYPEHSTPTLLYRATVGVGKTYQMIGLVGLALEHGMRVLVRAPTTKLAEDIATSINKTYPDSAAVWYGREQINPKDSPKPMCPRSDAVASLIALGGKPDAACGTRKVGLCKYHPKSKIGPSCGYKNQDLRSKAVVVVAGDAILTLAPRKRIQRGIGSKYHLSIKSEPDLFGFQTEINFKKRPQLNDRRDFDLIILDETDPLGCLSGFSDPNIYRPHEKGEELSFFEPTDVDILYGFSVMLYELLGNSQSEYLNITEFLSWLPNDINNKIDILEEVQETAKSNLREPLALGAYHRLSGKEIHQANQRISKQRVYLKAVIDICEAIKNALINKSCDAVHLLISEQDNGKSINIRKRTKLSPAYRSTPMVIFDATPRIALLEHTYPDIELRFSRDVKDGPLVKRFQLLDTPLSYKTLDKEQWSARLVLLSELLAISHGETGLICPKKVEAFAFEKLNTLTRINHFGALRGDNSFAELSCVLVASRQAQHYKQTEDMAAVLSSQPVQRLQNDEVGFDWYPKESTYIVHRSGDRGWSVKNDYHPDKLVEAVRASITHDNLEQALGRTRSIRRNAKPLHEYILTNIATNRKADGVFSMTELKAATSWIGILLHSGIWVASGKGMAVLFYVFQGLMSQRRDSLYILLIGNPAFETPEQVVKWRKDQISDNRAIEQFVGMLDKALKNRSASVDLLHSSFPISDFVLVKAKVRGTRYFSDVYVRIGFKESAVQALQRLLGQSFQEIEIQPE